MREVCVSCFFIVVAVLGVGGQDFDLTVIHINDFHARYEPVSESTSPCQPGDNELGYCYGGIARVATALKQFKESMPNPVLINGGDNYQGTLLYSLFKWNITVEFMNKLPIDITAIGNHEFDDGIAGAVPYLEKMNSKMLAANIDATNEPTIQGLFESSTMLDRSGRKIGVIGCIASDTNELSSTEDLIFLDEVEPVKAEAAKLRADGANIIILVSHSGYERDLEVAAQVPDLDIIVGSHSHTFLYTNGPEPPSHNESYVGGEYPTVVSHSGGQKVLVVQAYAHSKYVGVLNLKFDSEGEVVSYSGNPVLLDKTVEEDPDVKAALQPWVDEADEMGQEKLGYTLVLLDKEGCYDSECNIGNFLTDALVIEQMARTTDDDYWSYCAVALMNPGGIRSSIGENPEITYNDLVTSQPFENSIDTIELQGKDLQQLLEQGATKKLKGLRAGGRSVLQMSGMMVKFNMSLPEGSKVTELLIRCNKCRVPEYFPMEEEKWYPVAMPSFLSEGGDGFTIIPERGRNKVIGDTDVDVYSRYIAKESPIATGIENRITFI